MSNIMKQRSPHRVAQNVKHKHGIARSCVGNRTFPASSGNTRPTTNWPESDDVLHGGHNRGRSHGSSDAGFDGHDPNDSDSTAPLTDQGDIGNMSVTVTSPEGHTNEFEVVNRTIVTITMVDNTIVSSRAEIKSCFPALDRIIQQFLNERMACSVEDWVIIRREMKHFKELEDQEFKICLLKNPFTFKKMLEYHHGKPLSLILNEKEPLAASYLWAEAIFYGNTHLANDIFATTRCVLRLLFPVSFVCHVFTCSHIAVSVISSPAVFFSLTLGATGNVP